VVLHLQLPRPWPLLLLQVQCCSEEWVLPQLHVLQMQMYLD
jgi:hypothetical protein